MRGEITPIVSNNSCVAILIAVVLKKLIQFKGKFASSVLNRISLIASVYVHSWSVDLGTPKATKVSVFLQNHSLIFWNSNVNETELDAPMTQCFIVF